MTWNDVLRLTEANLKPDRKVIKTTEEWKALLTPEQFHITREHGTEWAFSGEYCEVQAPGLYACVCCHTKLFDSTSKFNSYTGLAQFYRTGKGQRNSV